MKLRYKIGIATVVAAGTFTALQPKESNWEITREPMWLINAATGNRNLDNYPEDNARGYQGWFRGPDAVPNLIGKIDEGYAHGARWFVINRPMGTDGMSYVPGATWLTLSDGRRMDLTVMLADALLDRYDEPVHTVWFVGSTMDDPRDIGGWTEARDSEFWTVGSTDTWEQQVGTRVTLGGWLSTGASGFVFDASSKYVDDFVALEEQLSGDPFNLFIAMEAYPMRDGIIDYDILHKMPVYATETYTRRRFPVLSLPWDSRVYVMYEKGNYGTDSQKRDIIQRDMRDYLIPVTNDQLMFETAMQIYRSQK